MTHWDVAHYHQWEQSGPAMILCRICGRLIPQPVRTSIHSVPATTGPTSCDGCGMFAGHEGKCQP